MGQTNDETGDDIWDVLSKLTWIISIAMAMLVFKDAESKVGVDGKISFASPAIWAICVFLVWILFFPWYIIVRNDKKKHKKSKKRNMPKKKNRR